MTTTRTTPQELYNLQEVDHRIDGMDAERKRLERRLAAGVNRPDLTREAERNAERARAIGENVRDRRAEAERLRERLTGLEARLYDPMTSRRDLSTIQREVDSAKYQISQVDGVIVEQEGEQRTHEEAAQSAQAEMEAAEGQWQSDVAEINERLERLSEELEEAAGQREELSEALPAADRQRYERLRRTKAGTAVARVDNGRVCLSCRMMLTSNVMRQLRDKSRQVPCSACGRILYQP